MRTPTKVHPAVDSCRTPLFHTWMSGPCRSLRRWWGGWLAVAILPTLLTFLPSGLVLRGLLYCVPGLLVGFGVAWLVLRGRTAGAYPRLLSLMVAYAFGAGPWIGLHLGGGIGSDLILPMHMGPFTAAAEGIHASSDHVSVPLTLGLVAVVSGSMIKPSAAWVVALAPLIYAWFLMGTAWLTVSV